MDKNEVITLSSDEESDITHKFQKSHTSKIIQPVFKGSSNTINTYLDQFQHINVNKDLIIRSNKQGVQFVKLAKVPEKKRNIFSPEIVDLEGYEKSVDDEQITEIKYTNSKNNTSPKTDEIHSNLDIVDVYEIPNESDLPDNTKIIKSSVTSTSKVTKIEDTIQTDNKQEVKINESSQPNLIFFTEFVDHCGSLEEIPNDRTKLTKKLMKRYGEADSDYIKSQEFRNLIQKCRDKVTRHNLYLIAKEITDELTYKKKIEINAGKSNLVQETCQRQENTGTEIVKQGNLKQNKKRTKVINKIIKRLDKLGSKIKELEEKEVDLSDEEESAYIQLQRYRERFCQIYTKLCKYTNEVADADRCYSRRICFTESKYPAINKCIENWLNKTKRFPDFSDIVKLLESQSASLGLPSNRESIRLIAIEIFQQVGLMLQRRRKYDLWDSFCAFLDEGEDPAEKDASLSQILNNNYEIRIKKEQEIFQHYAELQEKERLEPVEVPDEEANRSPEESGNEDDLEIEIIENSLRKRLDEAIKTDTEDNDNAAGNSGPEESKNDSSDGKVTTKESKNNYKNCKSLKWRLENRIEGKGESVNSENSVTGPEVEKETQKNEMNGATDQTKPNCDLKEDISKTQGHVKPVLRFHSSSKRKWNSEGDEVMSKKCSNAENGGKDLDVFEVDKEILGKEASEVFQVNCCQIVSDGVFEGFTEKRKDWGKRKVFRDLTNVGRLMGLHWRKRKTSRLFSPSFFRRSFFDFEKRSWKKTFKVSFKLVGMKGKRCGLNQEEKSGKTSNSDRGRDKKNMGNNSEGMGDDDNKESFLGGRGNGSEGDNNGDENKKNGRTSDELNENQHEEDDEEEEEETEKEEHINKPEGMSTEHSFTEQETEKSPDEQAVSNQQEKTNEEDVSHGEKSGGDTKLETETQDGEEKQPEKNVETEAPSVKEVGECRPLRVVGGGESVETGSEKPIEAAIENSIEMGNEKPIEKGNENPMETASEKPMETGNEKPEQKNGEGEKVAEATDEVPRRENQRNPQRGKKREIRTRKENVRVKPESESSNQYVKCVNKPKQLEENAVEQRTGRRLGNKRTFIAKENERVRERREVRETAEFKATTIRKPIQVEPPVQRLNRRNTPSTSDEERVKRFLLHSPSSISITPPRKLTLSKPPSQAAMQALATLRNLKGISATIVRGGKPKSEDDVVVIGGSYKRSAEQNSTPGKRRRGALPVISNVQSMDTTTPKIVTVQGNVSGFENSWSEVSAEGNSQCNSSSIRISNVWGSFPNTFMQPASNSEAVTPGCSFRMDNPGSSNPVKKKNSKKTVEYVVLD